MMVYAYFDPIIHAMATATLPPEGVDYIEVDDDVDVNEFYLSEGAIKRRPLRPHPWMIFDPAAEAWVDNRDPDEELATARSAASMSRPDFLLAAITAGIIQPSDAGPAARGEIPPSLTAVFAALPEDVQLEAVVRWGAATIIERTNPVLAALAAAMGVTDEQLDALFGI